MELIIEEKTTEYYTATVEQEKYIWTLGEELSERYKLWLEIDDWCEQTFGTQGMWGHNPSAWKRMGPSYYFQHDKDREWFVLRWS